MNEAILNKELIEQLSKTYPTPFYIYDEAGIKRSAKEINAAFHWVPGGFKNYFAVKALPNPSILKILHEQEMGADCSSMPELILSDRAGIKGENIMFTSNNTPAQEYREAKSLNAIINLDDISHIDFLEETCGLPEILSCRYNPGNEKAGNVLIGNPVDAKFGLTKDQMFKAYEMMKEKGVKRFGIHTMVASNELNIDYFLETANLLFTLVVEISKKLDIQFEFINLGGGIGIPYKPEEQEVDIEALSKEIRNLYSKIIIEEGLELPKLYMECGRLITGRHGYLVTKAIHSKSTYKEYIGVDASSANLMRPALYGAYHHITVLGKEKAKSDQVYDVVGSLCENSDKLAINRNLPSIEKGDYLVIHDAGAHGHSMGYNYNGKLRCAELLLKEDGSVKQIRRAETLADYFSTIDFVGL